MTKYLISFPGATMQQLTDEELAMASTDSHAVICSQELREFGFDPHS